MKYTIETMDNELCNLESNDEKVRKKASSYFMRAACKELGTKDTKQIKVWFIINTDKYISAIKKETNIDNIWNNVYTLQSFCARYIHLSHLYKADSDIITEDKINHFEEESKKYVRYLLETQKHPKVLQAVASFFWIYEEAFVWDVFIKVLEKKRDKLTLSHIKIAIRQCYSSSQNNQVKKYMSEQQREELIAILKEKNILQKEISLLENM